MGNFEKVDSKYFIELKSRDEFPFSVHYSVDDDFFSGDDKMDIHGGALEVDVEVSKLGDGYTLNVDIDGSVKVQCDRCLGDLSIDVENHLELRVRDDDGVESDDEDLILLAQSETGVDLEWTIFEMALLALPLRRVHDDGECDEKVMSILSGYSKSDEPEQPVDDRWEALKALKK